MRGMKRTASVTPASLIPKIIPKCVRMYLNVTVNLERKGDIPRTCSGPCLSVFVVRMMIVSRRPYSDDALHVRFVRLGYLSWAVTVVKSAMGKSGHAKQGLGRRKTRKSALPRELGRPSRLRHPGKGKRAKTRKKLGTWLSLGSILQYAAMYLCNVYSQRL